MTTPSQHATSVLLVSLSLLHLGIQVAPAHVGVYVCDGVIQEKRCTQVPQSVLWKLAGRGKKGGTRGSERERSEGDGGREDVVRGGIATHGRERGRMKEKERIKNLPFEQASSVVEGLGTSRVQMDCS